MDSLRPHVKRSGQDDAAYATLPGDPAGVERIEGFLEDIKEVAFNGGHKNVNGIYKGAWVMAISTGMSGASTGIAVEELHRIGIKNMIRTGDCGALQRDIHMGDLLLIHGTIRDDSTSRFCVKEQYPAVSDAELLVCMVETAKTFHFPFHMGKCRSHDSFYADREDEIGACWYKKGILGTGMEAAVLFTISTLRGIRTTSVLNMVSLLEGSLEEGINRYAEDIYQTTEGEKNGILLTLETIVRMEKKVCEQGAGR